jgi:phospholipase/carboxylesterase
MSTQHHYQLVKTDQQNAPVLLLLHGTGGNEHDLLPIGRQLMPHAHLLGVRGQVSENGMNRFFRRFAEGVFDVEDMQLRSRQLYDFLQNIAQQEQLDLQKLVALGYSNGANMAGSMLLMYPDLLRAVVQWRPMIPFKPAADWQLPKTPILMTAGKHDPLADVSHVQQWADMVKSGGGTVQLHFWGAGHSLVQDDLTAAQRFLSTYV